MIHRLPTPRVHGAWTHPWFAGDARLSAVFGPAPTRPALLERAERIHAPAGWSASVRAPGGGPPPDEDALLVLAGQQPVLAGGPALVVHKAVTAIALARRLAAELDRPVLPVFLLATQDHDDTEIDHVDLIDDQRRLARVRCPVSPPKEMFARASWDAAGFATALRRLGQLEPGLVPTLERVLAASEPGEPVATHVSRLIDDVLGPLGLHQVEAHDLAGGAEGVLARALGDQKTHRHALSNGARGLEDLDLGAAFDPEDPRPLVLESRTGRRQRLEPGDEEAAARLARRPDDFSPHAALRPLVQAACLPVVAQVAGPSEILYLGQARALHDLHDLTPPLLVPRLEATRLSPAEHAELAPDYDLTPDRSDPGGLGDDLIEAGRRFAGSLADQEPSAGADAERWLRRLERDRRRLEARPFWRGRRLGDLAQRLRPRGRPQDAVLAWLPDAFRHGAPQAWAEHLLGLHDPTTPPVHVFHTPPGDVADG